MNLLVQMQILAQKVHLQNASRQGVLQKNLFNTSPPPKLFPLALCYWWLSEMSSWIEGALIWITPFVLMSNFFALEWYSFNITHLHLHCWVDKPGFGNDIQTQIIHSQQRPKLIVVPSSSSQRCSHCCTMLRRHCSYESKEIKSKELNPSPFSYDKWNFFSILIEDLGATSLELTQNHRIIVRFIQWCW